MENSNQTDTDKPPFFNSWRPIYALVIGFLVAQIIIFYGITKYFE